MYRMHCSVATGHPDVSGFGLGMSVKCEVGGGCAGFQRVCLSTEGPLCSYQRISGMPHGLLARVARYRKRTLGSKPMSPLSHSDGYDAPRLIDELVSSEAAVVDDIVVGFEDTVRQPVGHFDKPLAHSGAACFTLPSR